MMPDAFPFEPVLRLWVLTASLIVMAVLIAILVTSHALDHFARRRERAVQRCARGSPDIPKPPAAAPAFDPVQMLPSSLRVGNRLARVHQHACPSHRPQTLGDRSAQIHAVERQENAHGR